MLFEDLNLNTPLRNALNDLGYTEPTPIQKESYSLIMSGKDIVGIAQTGTGKTFAYLLPLLRLLKYSTQKHPRILIVVPTRELVTQVVNEIEKLTAYMSVRFEGVYGGTNIKTQKRKVYKGLDILVATPGRLYDLALSGVLRLKSIKKIVIDEVDEMLNLGFRNMLTNLMDTLPQKRQNLMFSATLSEDVQKVISEYFYNPYKIEVESHRTPPEKIIQKAYLVPNFFTKINLLELLLKSEDEFSKVLVFACTKKLADRLFEHIEKKFPKQIGIIHSNKSQNFRNNSIKNFQENTIRVLIATDIIARGLDIRNVSHVINFDTPEIPGDYIHRIGRTGRAESQGVAITFVNEAEQTLQMEIEKFINTMIPLEPVPEDLEISTVFTEEEKPILYNVNYLKTSSIRGSKGAFHEKSEKNKQVNSGSPSRKRKFKKAKPQKRSKRKK